MRLIRKFVTYIRIFYYKLLSDKEVIIEGAPIFHQPVLFLGKGKIVFGQNVHLGYFPSPGYYSGYIHLEVRNASSIINVRDNVIINNNTSIISNGQSILIEEQTLIGLGVTILDSDFHGLYHQSRNDNSRVINKRVLIGKNTFIGNNATILKGSQIGDNSIIGAGSVVRGKVPPSVVYAGNPGNVVIHLDS